MALFKRASLVQAWCQDKGLPIPNKDTGAYSRGRGRLGMEFLDGASVRINDHPNVRIRPADTYQGHVVKSIDGSSMSLDNTEANQKEYPQPSSQKADCGFPVMGIMGVLNRAYGGWEDFVEGKQSAHDASIFRKLLHCFNAGDILCGDRAFCTYEIMATMQSKEVHCVMRLHQARHRVLSWRKGKKIGSNQRLVTWQKPDKRPLDSMMSIEDWESLPEEMTIRLIRFEFKDRDGKKRRMVLDHNPARS